MSLTNSSQIKKRRVIFEDDDDDEMPPLPNASTPPYRHHGHGPSDDAVIPRKKARHAAVTAPDICSSSTQLTTTTPEDVFSANYMPAEVSDNCNYNKQSGSKEGNKTHAAESFVPEQEPHPSSVLGSPSLAKTTATNRNDHYESSSLPHHFDVGDNLQAFKLQIEAKRTALDSATKRHSTAKLKECVIQQKVDSLSLQCKEMEGYLAQKRKDLHDAMAEQEKASLKTQARDLKKKQLEMEHDALWQKLSPPPPPPTTTTTCNGGIPLPSSTLVADIVGSSTGSTQQSSKNQAPTGRSQMVNDDSASTKKTNTGRTAASNYNSKDSSTKDGRKKELLRLAAIAEKDNAAKETLIRFMNGVTISKLRRVLQLPTKHRVRTLQSRECLGMMRVFSHGGFHLRSDFRERMDMEGNCHLKQWLISSNSHKIEIGRKTEDMQDRLIQFLEFYDD